MDVFVPDIYAQSIYTIDYKKLKKRGIKCLLFDLNNTLASYEVEYPDDKLREKMFELEKDFRVVIVSNSNKNRLRPFKEKLNLDTSFSSKKPSTKKLKKIINLFNLKDTEVAFKMNFTTILVNPISEDEPFLVRISRHFERKIIKKLNKKGILFKGEYYE